jgi:DNA-binding transcriptional regulator YhcF (GntR family)
LLKHELKKLVLDRAPTKYPKSVVTVLHRILELTYVPDWRTSDAELCYSRALPISKWAFHSNLEWHTTQRAIKTLTKDGVIKMNPQAESSYAVVPSALQLLESKFRNTSVRQLERKILNAVRMMVSRKEQHISRERKSFEDSMRDSNPKRYTEQKALGRFDWDTLGTGPTLAETHPEQCLCGPKFCSHPSTI